MLLASLLVASAAPADAAETVTIKGAGEVHGGMYITESGGLDALGNFGGKRVSLLGWFSSITNVGGAEADVPGKWNDHIQVLSQAWANRATPFMNLMVDAPNGTSAAVASGAFDADIRRYASYLKRWLGGEGAGPKQGRSVILSPMPEMNGSWTRWSCNPSGYKDAFRRFVRIIRDGYGIGTDQVRFSFSPNGWTSPGCGRIADYYPGDAYVDVIGLSAFNFGSSLGSWQEVEIVMDPWLEDIRDFAPSKPLLIAQTGSCPEGGNESQWAYDMMRYTADHPNVVAFIWFNFDKECDWRAFNPSNNSGLDGWKRGMQLSSTKYEFHMYSWFVANSTLQVGSSATSVSPPPESAPEPPDPEPDDPAAPEEESGASESNSEASDDDAAAGDDEGDSPDAAPEPAEPVEPIGVQWCEGLVATIVGTDLADVLRGSDGADVIVGLGGNDVIVGAGGNDVICGNEGDDILVGDLGDDLLVGSSGRDTLWGGDGDDILDGGDGRDFLRGQAGGDLLLGHAGDDELRGGDDADVLEGAGGNDILRGGPGIDTIQGGTGDDVGIGGDGNDLLMGGDGRDELIGSSGHDSLRGEGGNDLLDGGEGTDSLAGGVGIDRCANGESLFSCEDGSESPRDVNFL